ncbi:hypothetical protein QFZ77_006684 [Paenibacillus sp. V4I3]|nr:S-layer homology domain-containing protein [Paenibacillus sp. V4I3]MDQ0878025.1 hypothetical protein [Paenibacillus sp. V4I3]
MDRVFTFSKLKAVCEPSNTVTSIVYGCQSPAEQSYIDLPSSHWASPVFTKAKNLNLLQGYSDGTIRPNQSITRGEVAFLFDRLLQMSSSTTNNQPAVVSSASFNDVPETLWSAKAIYALRNKGIIDGITDTAFKPSQTITRAEIAAMLNRYYK